MAEARSKAEWGRMSSLMALTANVHLLPRRPLKPSDFDPYARRIGEKGKIGGDQMVALLDRLFCKTKTNLTS